MDVGEARVLDLGGLDRLLAALVRRGYRVEGPVVRDGAIVHGRLATAADLPAGWHDDQGPGTYRLSDAGDGAVFGWAVGPVSWKPSFLPARQVVWQAASAAAAAAGSVDLGPAPGGKASDGSTAAVPDGLGEPEGTAGPGPLAIVGARPCEVAALGILDRVLAGGPVPDPDYADRRNGTFIVVAECGTPASTCFCTSMGTGPAASGTYDLALTELAERGTSRFLVRAGSAAGAEVAAEIGGRPAHAVDLARRQAVLDAAAQAIVRRVDPARAAGLAGRAGPTGGSSTPPPASVPTAAARPGNAADRCLACGNCTMVCPTCFCTDVHDVSDLAGGIVRERTWASCFDRSHSELHGGAVRASVRSRYHQWLTHKFSTWWDQFGTAGCVGCGRCITWCPAGIDVTEELAALDAGRTGGGVLDAGGTGGGPRGGQANGSVAPW